MSGADVERYSRAKQVVTQAFKLPEHEREAFIGEKCDGDAALRAEVDWMLDACIRTLGRFLGESPVETLIDDIAQLQILSSSDYKLIELLGNGGMGNVYLAERTSGGYTQRVAVKFLNMAALHSPDAVARFTAEQQILAELNHSNIPKLLDGGTFSDGRPFLTVEYVNGIHIDKYCQLHARTLEGRLRLFLKVCAAVHYAHLRLVAHRDIKPGNIMVTTDGEPMLLDFGIARLMHPNTGDPALTQEGRRFFTPAYASPEQVTGKRLTVATDIYSLGVVLYELLCGQSPYGAQVGPDEMLRAVADIEPIPPSSALAEAEKYFGATPQRRTRLWRRSRQIPLDVDAIVLKALRKQPEDRYASVQDMAKDIQRFLDGHPVQARRGNNAYRLRKFVGRHKIGVGMTVGALAMGVAFLINRQLNLEQVRTERERAEQVVSLLTDVFRSADPSLSERSDVTVREVLDRNVTRMTELAQREPVLAARMLYVMGATYSGLARYEQAVETLTRAKDLAEQEQGLPIEVRVGILGELGGAQYQTGQATEGEASLRAALALGSASMPKNAPMVSEFRADLAFNLSRQCEDCTEEVIELARTAWHAGEDESGRDSATALGLARNYAEVLIERGRWPVALEVLEDASTRAARHLGESNSTYVEMRGTQARLLGLMNRAEEADEMLTKVIAVSEQIFGPNSPALAAQVGNLATIKAGRGDYTAAAELTLRSLRMAERDQGPNSPVARMSLCNYAFLLNRAKDLERALSTARECVARREAADVSAFDKAHARHVLTLVLRANNLPEQAYDVEWEAFRLLTPVAERNWPMYRWIVANALELSVDLGRMRESIDALAAFRKVIGTEGAIAVDPHYLRYFEAMRMIAEGAGDQAWPELVAAAHGAAVPDIVCTREANIIWNAALAQATTTARRQELGAVPQCPES